MSNLRVRRKFDAEIALYTRFRHKNCNRQGHFFFFSGFEKSPFMVIFEYSKFDPFPYNSDVVLCAGHETTSKNCTGKGQNSSLHKNRGAIFVQHLKFDHCSCNFCVRFVRAAQIAPYARFRHKNCSPMVKFEVYENRRRVSPTFDRSSKWHFLCNFCARFAREAQIGRRNRTLRAISTQKLHMKGSFLGYFADGDVVGELHADCVKIKGQTG